MNVAGNKIITHNTTKKTDWNVSASLYLIWVVFKSDFKARRAALLVRFKIECDSFENLV